MPRHLGAALTTCVEVCVRHIKQVLCTGPPKMFNGWPEEFWIGIVRLDGVLNYVD